MRKLERENIYLIGFMGAGKSTIAPRLAEALDLDWLDTDDLIEEKAGLSIPEIFDYYGEERFREIEHQVIREVSQGEGKVVAVGGGAPMDNDNWQLLKSTGKVVYLEISPGEIMERVSSDGSRPLLADLNQEEKRNKIRKLLKIRHPRYSEADYIILCDGTGTGTVVEEVAQKLAGEDENG